MRSLDSASRVTILKGLEEKEKVLIRQHLAELAKDEPVQKS